MKKLLALALCLVLALTCIGTAESSVPALNYQVSAKLNVMGQQLLDAILGIGTDEDGNYAADFKLADGTIDAFARIAKDCSAVTAGANGIAFTITKAAVTEALQALFASAADSAEQAGLPVTELIAYVQNGAYMDDFYTAQAILNNELNRLMQCAYANGIIVIDEAGNMTITATADTVVKTAAMYLQQLSADDATFTALTAMNLWGILQLPDAATCKALVAALVQELSAVDTTAANACFYLYIGADGQIEGTFVADESSITVSNANNALVITMTDGDDFTYYWAKEGNQVTMVEKVEGMTVTAIVTYAEDGITEDIVVTNDADNTVIMSEYVVINDAGLTMSIEMSEDNTVLDLAIDFTTYSFVITGCDDETVVTMTGAPEAVENGFAYTINAKFNDETEVLTFGYRINEDNSVTLYATDNGITYYVTAGYSMTEAGGLEGWIDVNGMYGITAGYAAEQDGTIVLYVSVNGQMYYVTISTGYEENGSITITGKAFSSIEGMEGDTELGSLIVNILPTVQPLAHKDGVVLTAEDLLTLVNSILEGAAEDNYDYDYNYNYNSGYAA